MVPIISTKRIQRIHSKSISLDDIDTHPPKSQASSLDPRMPSGVLQALNGSGQRRFRRIGCSYNFAGSNRSFVEIYPSRMWLIKGATTRPCGGNISGNSRVAKTLPSGPMARSIPGCPVARRALGTEDRTETRLECSNCKHGHALFLNSLKQRQMDCFT